MRAATALRLDDDSTDGFSPFDREIRRRLFFAIGMLDTHSAIDRGTVTMLPSSAFRSPPLDISDSDMTPSHVPCRSPSTLSEMSLTAMIHAGMTCHRHIYEYSLDADSNTWAHWTKMMGAFNEFQKYVETDLCRIGNATCPLAMLHRATGTKILTSIRLLLRRPPFRRPRNIVPPWDNMNILEVATSVLEQHMQPMPVELAPWAWKNWVQWHALAIVLAELMVQPQGPLSERAYAIATRTFTKYAKFIADGEFGLLWKPIARLMHRVQRTRLSPSHRMSPRTPQDTASDPLNSGATLLQETLPDLNLFDFNNWSVPTGDPFFLTSEQDQNYDKFESLHVAEDKQWLAWDYFLQDLNFPAV